MRKAVLIVFLLSLLGAATVVLLPGFNSGFGLQLVAVVTWPVGPLIALFLFLSPSVAMYTAVLLPWALTKKSAPQASSLLRIGLFAGAFLALAMPIASRFALWNISSQYGAEDVTLRAFQATPKKAVHVELMSPTPWGRGPQHSYAGGCGQLCQVILAEGLAEKVTVSHTRQRIPKFHRRRRSQRGNEPRQESREVFVQVGFKNSFTLKKGDVCPELYPKLEPIPAVVKLRAKGRCIVMTDPGTKWPTYSFRETELIDVDKKEAEFLTGAFESRRFEVMQRQGNDLVQIHAKTMVAAHPISLPFSYQPWHQRGRGRRGSFSRWLSRITAIVHRARHETRAFKFETEVVHWLQPFKSGQWPEVGSGPPPLEKYETVEKRLAKRETITSTELVQALLARPGPEPHGIGATQTLRNWALEPLWRKKPDETAIKTAIAVLRDRRFEDLNILPSSMARRPEEFLNEIPTILERLERATQALNGPKPGGLSGLLAAMPIEYLKPHAERILTIAANSKNTHPWGLFQIAGQLGYDSSELFKRWVRSEKGRTPSPVRQGICRADRRIALKLLPNLQSELEYALARKRVDLSYLRALAVAFIRHGQAQTAVDLIEASAHQAKLLRGLERDLERGENFHAGYCR